MMPADVSTRPHACSFNPSSCKRGIIYSRVFRYHRTISDDDDFTHHLGDRRTTLTRQYDNIGLIIDTFNKVRPLSRDNLFQYHQYPITVKLPFFDPFYSNALQIGQKYTTTGTLSRLMVSSVTPVVAFKRNASISDILVHCIMATLIDSIW